MRTLLIPTLTIALLSAGAASAQDAPTPDVGEQDAGVFRISDEGATCAQISDEAAQLGEAMGDATPQGGWLSSLGGIARSGAAMLAPVTAVAMAGVDAVRQPARDRDEAEQALVRNRWYYLNGLHIGRGCREQAPVQAEAPGQTATQGTAPAIQPVALAVPASSDR
ncbi:hypothetical protein [Brevundimonas sp.]|uniref:hypothetical protein n=1 Tax=Brevundimonas sp. TaxID=1871086 RepID=UPI00286B1C09|nr:hypothetical protein [Brevundimonas sp.]